MLVTSVLVQLYKYVELVSLDERTDLLEQYKAASDMAGSASHSPVPSHSAQDKDIDDSR